MIRLSPDAIADVARVRDFLSEQNPGAAKRALAAIWTALERLQKFPDLGMRTEDSDIRQIFIRFGASGYVVRYAIGPDSGDIFVTRIWHGRETRL
jgi:toxin ParE1/3/4